MKNWKTSLMGALAFMSMGYDSVATQYGMPALPPKAANGITLAMLAIGLFQSKDKDVTGGTRKQSSK